MKGQIQEVEIGFNNLPDQPGSVTDKSEKYINIYFLNPVAPIVEAFRYAFLGAGTLDISRLGYSLGFTLVTLLVGLILFNKVERNFMDTV